MQLTPLQLALRSIIIVVRVFSCLRFRSRSSNLFPLAYSTPWPHLLSVFCNNNFFSFFFLNKFLAVSAIFLFFPHSAYFQRKISHFFPFPSLSITLFCQFSSFPLLCMGSISLFLPSSPPPSIPRSLPLFYHFPPLLPFSFPCIRVLIIQSHFPPFCHQQRTLHHIHMNIMQIRQQN